MNKKIFLSLLAASLFVSGCVKQPSNTQISSPELTEAIANLIEDMNTTREAIKKMGGTTTNSTSATALGCGLGVDQNGSCATTSNDALLVAVEKIDAHYFAVTDAQQKQIEELKKEIEKLTSKSNEADAAIPNLLIDTNSSVVPKEEKIVVASMGQTPKSPLGDRPCSIQSEICYVSVAGVNVRKNPCATNNVADCVTVRVQTYGEVVYPQKEAKGISKPDSVWFQIAGGGWVRDYTLRELDPTMPAQVLTITTSTEIVSNPFNGTVIGTADQGVQLEVSGCALGWCKLYKKAGYILHSATSSKQTKE